jgi:uncharacterized membrane protein YhaH (DUF805 family)
MLKMFLISFAGMIQRIQSIFMALAAVWAILMIIVDPVYFEMIASDKMYELKGQGLFLLSDIEPQLSSYPVLALLALLAIVPMGAILRFKDRKLQMKLMRLNMILALGFIGLAVFYIDRSQALIGEETDIIPSIWFYTSAVPILFSILANRFIKKDEDLVKAADRLR